MSSIAEQLVDTSVGSKRVATPRRLRDYFNATFIVRKVADKRNCTRGANADNCFSEQMKVLSVGVRR